MGLSEMIHITVSREEVDFSNLVNRLATEILKSKLHLALFLVGLVDDLLSSSAETLTGTVSLQIKKYYKKYSTTHSVSQSLTSFLNFLRNSFHYVFVINLI